MQPLYSPHNVTPAYQLNWGLTVFWRTDPIPENNWLTALQKATQPDGIRVKKHRFRSKNTSQFFLSTQPSVAPSGLIAKVKGRLQHAVRTQLPKAFQRNYALRSIGSAKRAVVEDYVATQLEHHKMADPQVQSRLALYQTTFPEVNLGLPSVTAHGKYWYNLHVVIVNNDRLMEISDKVLTRLTNTITGAALKHRHRLSRLSVLPDHIHMTIGCNIDESPEEIALGYLNNCAYSYGMNPVFQYSYYVGTFGEYDRGAVA